MIRVEPGLASNPDRLRWNAKYGAGLQASFEPAQIAVEALALVLPDGPVLELASGPSGSALLAASAGRHVVAIDASDVALGMLADEADRRGLGGLITLVHADLRVWRPEPARFSLVLCTGYWDRHLFPAAAEAVAPGGMLGWEAYTLEKRRERPTLPVGWCLADGEPASLLRPSWQVIGQVDLPGARRRLLTRAPSSTIPRPGAGLAQLPGRSAFSSALRRHGIRRQLWTQPDAPVTEWVPSCRRAGRPG